MTQPLLKIRITGVNLAARPVPAGGEVVADQKPFVASFEVVEDDAPGLPTPAGAGIGAANSFRVASATDVEPGVVYEVALKKVTA